MSREVQEPVPIESVEPNSIVRLEASATCLSMTFDPHADEWILSEPYELEEGTILLTHVTPYTHNLELDGTEVEVEGWHQVHSSREGFNSKVFILPGYSRADTHLILEESAQVSVLGSAYESRMRQHELSHYVIVRRYNSQSGEYEDFNIRIR